MTSNKKIITSAVFASLVLSGCNVSSFDSATDANKEEGVQAELPVVNVPKNAENRYVVIYNDAAKDTNSVLRDTGEFSTRRAERTLSTFNINVNSIIEHLPSNNASVVTLSDDQLAELQAMTNIATSPIAL
ncbi:MAG: hypothetical protein R3309_09435, partial [Reinekea sp.]|nr:hypothetical protein [Reinekea sp.]